MATILSQRRAIDALLSHPLGMSASFILPSSLKGANVVAATLLVERIAANPRPSSPGLFLNSLRALRTDSLPLCSR